MTLDLTDWIMKVWVEDRRCREGVRLLKTYTYTDKHQAWMQEEVRDLASGLYPAPKYRIEVHPATCVVKNLMSGEPVTIRWEDRGGPCDPSMERYWST